MLLCSDTGAEQMAEQKLTDARGKIIGFIKDFGDKKTLTNSNGKVLGSYDPRQDKTYNATGGLVGSGNQLSSLLR